MTEHERFINEYCRNVGNIKIRCDDCKFVDDCVDYGWQRCKKFTPAPSTPMTNEEWFCSLSTEEKAKVIANATYSSAMMWAEIIVFPKDDEVRKWEKWLKQPHTNE